MHSQGTRHLPSGQAAPSLRYNLLPSIIEGIGSPMRKYAGEVDFIQLVEHGR